MLARWRPCSTTSGELYRRDCANKKENAGRVANYLRTMGTIWRALSRPEIIMMGQIAYLDAYGATPCWPKPSLVGDVIRWHSAWRRDERGSFVSVHKRPSVGANAGKTCIRRWPTRFVNSPTRMRNKTPRFARASPTRG